MVVWRRLAEAWWRDRGQFSRPKIRRSCPMCDHRGVFVSVGRPSRWDVRCPSCGSRERHRLTHLWRMQGGTDRFAGRRILHFAPEKAVMRQMAGNQLYETADLHQAGVSHRLDIARTGLPDARYDVLIAHHVLEHVEDDRAAMAEMFRILRPGGLAILTVPINPTRQETYENPAITEPRLRFAHFGGEDHRRFYGMDLFSRLEKAGFAVETFRAPPEQEVMYGLLRDEWVTIAHKTCTGARLRQPVAAAT